VTLSCPTGFVGDFDLLCINEETRLVDGFCSPQSSSSLTSSTETVKDQTGTVVGLSLALAFTIIAFVTYVAFDRGFVSCNDVHSLFQDDASAGTKRDPESAKSTSSTSPEINTWHYSQNGESVGPVNDSKLIRHLKSLPVSDALATQVWNGSTVLEWRPVSEVSTLAVQLRGMWIPK